MMSKIQIRLTGARVLVKLFEPEDKTASGIIIPDSAKQPTLKGTVVRVGPGVTTEIGALVPPCVVPGDVVLLQAFTGTMIKENGEELLLINDRDILCCVELCTVDNTTMVPDDKALGITYSDS